jgi:hypothetical protein
MGTAKPMPMKTLCPVGFTSPVTIATTSPSIQHRAAGVAGIDSGVDLNQAGEPLAAVGNLKRAAETRHDAKAQ